MARHIWFALVITFAGFLGLQLFPVRSTLTRAALAVLLITSIGLLLALLWRRRVARWIAIGALTVVVAFMVSPGREPGRDRLRAAYVAALRDYDGCRYVWGGETRRGIDCSALPRLALAHANLRLGVRTVNPRCVRAALRLWWCDASARELGGGYSGRTVSVVRLDALEEAHGLLPGDIAIKHDGTHAAVYLGEGVWTEADPNAMRVRTWRPGEPFPLRRVAFHVVRWRELCE